MDYFEKIAQEKARAIAQMRQTAETVAAALTAETGEPWSAEPPTGDNWHDENYARLNNAAGRSFSLHRDRQRVSVYGCYPQPPAGGAVISSHDNPPEITFNPERPAQAIARDMARRFLPAFHALWVKAEGRIIEQGRRIVAQEAAAAALAEILATQPYQHGGRGSAVCLSAYGPNSAKFEVHSADYIHIELRVQDLDTARRIAMILAD